MRVADYVIQKLIKYDVRHVFMIVGGVSMYLNDAVIREKRIQYICNHHEQASTMAAECYARITGGVGVALVVSAAGSTNTLTGVLGAWWDSIPIIVISGNARSDLLTYTRPNLRQLGVQDTRIVDIVKPITKYAVTVYDPATIRYHMEKAIYLATTGRKGPVWLDIPLDVQSAEISQTALQPFIPPVMKKKDLSRDIQATVDHFRRSRHPVVIVGSGIRSSGSVALFHNVAAKLNAPVLTSLTAQDVMYETHPLYGGRFGPYGTQQGNDRIKEADFMLILGERLYLWQIGYEYMDFGKYAYKVMVDVDKEELTKPTLAIDLPIHADVKDFLTELSEQL